MGNEFYFWCTKKRDGLQRLDNRGKAVVREWGEHGLTDTYGPQGKEVSECYTNAWGKLWNIS